MRRGGHRGADGGDAQGAFAAVGGRHRLHGGAVSRGDERKHLFCGADVLFGAVSGRVERIPGRSVSVRVPHCHRAADHGVRDLFGIHRLCRGPHCHALHLAAAGERAAAEIRFRVRLQGHIPAGRIGSAVLCHFAGGIAAGGRCAVGLSGYRPPRRTEPCHAARCHCGGLSEGILLFPLRHLFVLFQLHHGGGLPLPELGDPGALRRAFRCRRAEKTAGGGVPIQRFCGAC